MSYATRGKVEIVTLIRDNRSQERVRRVRKERSETLFSHETATAPGSTLDLLELLRSAEVLSREQFPAVLTGLGLEGKQNTFKAEAGLPQKVEARLAGLDFLDVLLAVRDVHAAIKADGESPARLGALARGYALLGLLSEFEWHPAHRAFKARGLSLGSHLVIFACFCSKCFRIGQDKHTSLGALGTLCVEPIFAFVHKPESKTVARPSAWLAWCCQQTTDNGPLTSTSGRFACVPASRQVL